MAKTAPPESPDPWRLDLEAIRAGLLGGKGGGSWMQGWLPATWASPDRFHEALFAYAQARSGGKLKSRPRASYDLYHDLVLAHADTRRTAIASREGGGWRELSYDSLHEATAGLMTAWQQGGAVPGDSVCVVAPVGVDYAVTVLTALRMGLVVSVLPPIGASFVRSRLEAIDPDHVAAPESVRGILGARGKQALPVQGGARGPASQSSAGHSPDDVAMQVPPLMRAAAGPPFELTASRLHEALVRDAVLVYALEPTDIMAAPGVDPLSFQPQTLLATLLAGATWLEVPDREAQSDPRLLERATVLGVSPGLREVLLQRGIEPARGTKTWFHALTDVLDPRWDELSRLFATRKVRGLRVLSTTGTGGVALFGVRSPEALGLGVWPAPGERWQLSQIAGGLLPALTETGTYTIFRAEEEEDESFGRILLCKLDEAYVYGGSLDPGPRAQAYPADEIEALAVRHPGVRHAAALLTPGRWVNESLTVLLLFVEPGGDRAAWPDLVRTVRATIGEEAGEARVPSRVDVFPLRPRVRDGRLDRAWCRSEYLSGSLTRKARSELAKTLAQLGYIFGPGRT